ncbi:hypothetical protein IJE86_00545 [bacterium]|nr:hypothetical protein [bacterium]
MTNQNYNTNYQGNDFLANSNLVHVDAYTRDDGTPVREHYRSRPDGVNYATQQAVYPQTPEQQVVLSGGVSYNDYGDYGIQNNLNYLNNLVGSASKEIINGLAWVGAGIQPDAAALWHIASQVEDLWASEYIKANGALYQGADFLGSEYEQYRPYIKSKIKSQFGYEDVPGVVFHEYSNVANAIIKSEELKNFIDRNYNSLQYGQEVSGSIRFSGFSNLHNAFGSVDILSAKLNGNYVDVTILDTYDFNKGSKNILVQMGRSAQDAGLLNPYFTIVKCRYKLR